MMSLDDREFANRDLLGLGMCWRCGLKTRQLHSNYCRACTRARFWTWVAAIVAVAAFVALVVTLVVWAVPEGLR